MKHFALALTTVLMTLAAPLAAEDNPVVVELFTSQGCSSCPSADALLHELADREDVIALALHVDYWDYIGWEDPFADPGHTARQRAYASEGQRNMIYTPQMIVQGQSDIVGTKPMKLSETIMKHAQSQPPIDLALARSGDDISITAPAMTDIKDPVTVHMLRYTPLQTTEIKRGENAGKTLKYANVVSDWTALGEWDGRSDLDLQATAAGDKPVVVILQHGTVGPILAAARLR